PGEWPAPARIAAVSDVHGRLDALLRLLAAHGIVDGSRRWTFGTGHLVIDGDVFDKGAQVTAILWLIRSLEAQAQAAGGRVHLVMGNHESMSLRGNLRSLHPAYQAMGWRPQELFGPGSEQGRWLRTRPVLLRLGDTLFVHAGVCPALLEAELPVAACNARFSRALDLEKKDLLLSKQGPIWYRGLLPLGGAADATPAQVEALLGAFGVKRIVAGHQVLDRVRAFHGGRVFGIDAGMERGRPGELWIWDGGRPWRGLADGTRIPLDAPEAPAGR
ncbi:MAG TPA: metallophosphoesterase, partial [Holophaga sp.]|nr:metallophosphoesterase [Holophaga sp.]